MSLIEIRQLSYKTRIGLWRMDDDMPPQQSLTQRQKERIAVHSLLGVMMPSADRMTMAHEASGKPFLMLDEKPCKELSVSVSHTRGFAVLMLSEEAQVGIDIEYRSDRVENIASRFIHPSESAFSTEEKLLLWSAKETIYKLFSTDRLDFFDMLLKSWGSDTMLLENHKRRLAVNVHFETTPDYVLTYALLPNSKS